MKNLSIIFILIFRLSAFAQAPDWSVNPNEYEYSMSFSGIVSIDTVENTNTSSKIAAWVGDELRGTADPVYVTATGRYYYLLLVYANTVGETIEFTFYNADAGEVVDIIKEETFVSDKNLGSFSEPYVFKNWENDLFNEFAFAGFDAVAEVDTTGKQISFTLPANTDLASLVAVFQFDEATSIKVNGMEQQSGITANDFIIPVEYIVTTPNNTHTWTVNVTAEEVEEEEENYLFNEFAFAGFDAEAEIDTTGKQIAFTLPANSDPTSLVAVFQFDDATSIKVNGVEQQSSITVNDFTNPVEYLVTTPNNTHTWTVNVTVEETDEEPTITDIEDVDSDAELVLYPNPAQNILNIKSSSKILEYEIFNNCGVLTLRGELLNGIDVKHLPTGTYFIRIITENDDISVKRWVKH